MTTMSIQTLDTICKPCGHEFQAEIVVNAPVHVSVASMNAIRCPKCSAGPNGIYIWSKPRQANGVRLPGTSPAACPDTSPETGTD